MSRRSYHWLDEQAEILHRELRDMAAAGADALHGTVPLGTTTLDREERIIQWILMSPEDRARMGPEYRASMYGDLIDELGPLGAAALLPYLAPYEEEGYGEGT